MTGKLKKNRIVNIIKEHKTVYTTSQLVPLKLLLNLCSFFKYDTEKEKVWPNTNTVMLIAHCTENFYIHTNKMKRGRKNSNYNRNNT